MKTSWVLPLLLVPLCAATFARVAAAQDPIPPPLSTDPLVALFSGLSASESVRITTPLLFIEDAEFLRFAPGFVEVSQNGVRTTVDLDDIRSVSLKRGHPLQGTLWGIGVGALLGTFSGAMWASFNCQTPEGCAGVEKDGAIRWGTVFGVTGGLAGFVIGRYAVTWQPVFP